MMESKYPYSYAQLQALVEARLREIGHPERIPNWAMISGGAESGATWQRNYEAYRALGFRQRLIHEDVQPDLSASMCGQKVNMPVAAAPMAVALEMTHENAFVEMGIGCSRAGVATSLGFPAGATHVRDMREVCSSVFRIIKPHRNEAVLVEELKRAEAEGAFAVGVDLDSICGLKTGDDAGHFGEITKPYSVDMLKEIRSCVHVPFIVKGIMSGEDAEAARLAGADAIVVSTHAGYALDCTLSPLEVLEEIRGAIGRDMEVYVDSGIRRGTDVVKAMAMGADAVLVGRLMVWGLLIGGADGVEWMFHLLREEMARSMQLMGVSNWKELDRSCLVALNAMGREMLCRG